MKLRCSNCGKVVSTGAPETTIVRATLECPECTERVSGDARRDVAAGMEALKVNAEILLYGADPNCDHVLDPWCTSGIKCLKCGGWYCA
jgi:DNA-directed RNA polymerase subunit RPC12/RpoP